MSYKILKVDIKPTKRKAKCIICHKTLSESLPRLYFESNVEGHLGRKYVCRKCAGPFNERVIANLNFAMKATKQAVTIYDEMLSTEFKDVVLIEEL